MHIAKTSLLFREMGRKIGIAPIQTALHWETHARHAVIELSMSTESTAPTIAAMITDSSGDASSWVEEDDGWGDESPTSSQNEME